MAKDIQFKKFNMENLIYDNDKNYLNPRIAVIGKSGSGKGWLIRSILSYLKHIDGGIIICPTNKLNKFYDNFVPQSYIYDEYDEKIVG